jgi:hypothetical protein
VSSNETPYSSGRGTVCATMYSTPVSFSVPLFRRS